jgi:hypothetical protein
MDDREVQDWRDRLAMGPRLHHFNEFLPLLKEYDLETKRELWKMVQQHAEGRFWKFDHVKKAYALGKDDRPQTQTDIADLLKETS